MRARLSLRLAAWPLVLLGGSVIGGSGLGACAVEWAEPVEPHPASALSDGGLAPTERMVGVEQDGAPRPIDDGVVRLRRAPFVVLVNLPPGDFLLFGASEDPGVGRLAQSGAELSTIAPFRATGMAEGYWNEDRHVFLADHAPSAWFEQEDYARFDAPCEQTPGGWRCRRTVEQLIEVRQPRHEAPRLAPRRVEDPSLSKVYFVFARTNRTGERDARPPETLVLHFIDD